MKMYTYIYIYIDLLFLLFSRLIFNIAYLNKNERHTIATKQYVLHHVTYHDVIHDVMTYDVTAGRPYIFKFTFTVLIISYYNIGY